MIITGIFLLSFTSGLALVSLSLLDLLTRIQFWPPPKRNSWQSWTFWFLYRALFIGVVLLSLLDFADPGQGSRVLRYFIGLPIAGVGLGMTLYITCYLGWKNAHGQKRGLRTEGIYGWSRNPMYVISTVAFVGLGLVVNSLLLNILLALWVLFYLIAPFLEEPWLEKQYGDAFRIYKSRVPRFVRIVRNYENNKDRRSNNKNRDLTICLPVTESGKPSPKFLSGADNHQH